jgi:hypothetical protein
MDGDKNDLWKDDSSIQIQNEEHKGEQMNIELCDGSVILGNFEILSNLSIEL